MQTIAKQRGGRCVSKRYVNAASKLIWECNQKHRWEARPINIKQGQWCPTCASKRLSIESMQELAKSRGGKCLSKWYVNSSSKLTWECAHGHKWKAVPSSIKSQGTWCPYCSTGISERICRAYFRQLFGKPFPKVRPKWLVNERGMGMELDGYNKAIRVAFEHHGEQHYTNQSQYITSGSQLRQRKKDDQLKLKLCKENGVRLIVIPQLFQRTKLEDLQQLIYDECKRLRIRRRAGMLTKRVNLRRAWSTNESERALIEMQKIAEARGGKCISKRYIHLNHKLKWECGKKHQWNATPGNIKHNKSWCPQCSSTVPSMAEIRQLAKDRGGKCISKKYVHSTKQLEWECELGHRWKTLVGHIKAGRWCPICSGNVVRIRDMRLLAAKHGGKCLSRKYVDTHTPLKWECKRGHQWESKPKNVVKGHWCKLCVNEQQRHNLDLFRNIAKSKGGRCLSKSYINLEGPLKFKCSEGHEWTTKAKNVSSGSWCPKCASTETANSNRLTLQDVQKVAASKGGKCLSKEYVSARSKLHWECEYGHSWLARLDSIKNMGTWCPVCAGRKISTTS